MSSQQAPDTNDRTEPAQTCTCELDENLQILWKNPVFSGIPLERLRVYAYLSKRVRYQEGEFLFRQGESDDLGYIVTSGRVQVVREFEDHSVLLNEFGEGSFFGGLALLADIRRLFSARAATGVECLTIDRGSFRKLVAQFPEVGVTVMDMMLRRVVEMEEQLLRTEPHMCLYR
jgi:CRP/FNR family transcriptional regulator, cyclic AMP receptor protein